MKTIKGQALPAPAKKALSSSSWSDEFVAYPALSEEHLGIAGVILQFLSEPRDIFLEVTGVEVFLVPPPSAKAGAAASPSLHCAPGHIQWGLASPAAHLGLAHGGRNRSPACRRQMASQFSANIGLLS